MAEVILSTPPVFDFIKAMSAVETTAREGYVNSPTVRTAGNLWLYNAPPERWPFILRR